jgi:hypothetical protein
MCQLWCYSEHVYIPYFPTWIIFAHTTIIEIMVFCDVMQLWNPLTKLHSVTYRKNVIFRNTRTLDFFFLFHLCYSHNLVNTQLLNWLLKLKSLPLLHTIFILFSSIYLKRSSKIKFILLYLVNFHGAVVTIAFIISIVTVQVLVTHSSQWEALIHITLKICWRTTNCGWTYKMHNVEKSSLIFTPQHLG